MIFTFIKLIRFFSKPKLVTSLPEDEDVVTEGDVLVTGEGVVEPDPVGWGGPVGVEGLGGRLGLVGLGGRE